VNYDKAKIKNLLDKYCETENPNDFGELVIALEPMVQKIVKKWSKHQRHHEDMIQEILLTLWKKQGNVNKLKLVRMKKNQDGERICVTIYFYFVIRGYLGKVAPRIDSIFSNVKTYSTWFLFDPWMGNLEFDQGTKMFERGA